MPDGVLVDCWDGNQNDKDDETYDDGDDSCLENLICEYILFLISFSNGDDVAARCPTPFLVLKVHVKFPSSTLLFAHMPPLLR